MRVLLDNNVNQRFASLLIGHVAVHVRAVGLDKVQNGELISRAESMGFDALITCDKNMGYQQNSAGRKIRIIVLNSRRITLSQIAPLSPQVMEALQNSSEGSFITVSPS
jgi:predicted nuclease of predicted toxin-antitoxin system